MEIPQSLLVSTHKFIVARFSLGELRLLCLYLGIDWGGLGGGNQVPLRALDLIEHFQKVDPRFEKLLGQLAKERHDQLGSAQELLKEANLYGLQLVEDGDKEQARAIFRILSSVTSLQDQLCPELEKRVGEFLTEQAWDTAWMLLVGLKDILPDLECIDRLLEDHPRTTYGRANKAEKEKKWSKARGAFQELERNYPDYKDVVERLARLEQWQQWYIDGSQSWDGEHWEEAKEAFTQLFAECPHYEDTTQKLTALQGYAKGQQFMDAQDYEQAKPAFESVKQADAEFLQRRLSADLKQRAQQLTKKQLWDDAQTLLERLVPVLPKHSDLKPLLAQVQRPRKLYHQASEHVKENRWDEARQTLQELEREYPGYRDAAERLVRLEEWQQWYANGLRLWGDKQWEQAETALARLHAECPEYKDAERKLTALRNYATGQQFIDERDYEQAETAFEPVKHAEPEFLQYRLSASLEQRARQFIENQGWDDAQGLLEQLAAVLPSPAVLEPLLANARCPGELYRQAGEHLEKKRWDEVRKAFQELEKSYPGYRDAAEHLVRLERWESWYDEGRKLWNKKKWDKSAEAFSKLVGERPDYKDASERLQTLDECRRLADEGQQLIKDRQRLVAKQAWNRAEQVFEEISSRIAGYQDAPTCLLYVQTLHAINDRDWKEAEQQLEQIAAQNPGYADVDELQATIRRLQETSDRLAGGFLRDPWLRWVGSYPYDVFREAGLRTTPAASMKAVDEASFELQVSGMSPEQRAAWDTLRHVGRRLFVDAFLYRIEQADALVAFLEDAVANGFQLPSVQSLTDHFPQQSPLVLMLWERREEAITAQEIQQREAPHDTRLAHQLGLLYLAWAEELDARKQTQDVVRTWQQAIGQWAVVLTDEDYWHDWGRERAACYDQQVLPHQLEALQSKLEEELLQRLDESADWHARAERPAQADAHRQLRLELQAELAAVRLLRKLEGIPTAQHGRVFCGPGLLHSLGLSDALARYVAQLTDEPSGIETQVLVTPSETAVRRLRWYFSSLRLPAVLLEGTQSDPERSLDLLRSSGRVECDPPYRDLQRPDEVSEEDIWNLMAEAHLRIAEDRITREGAWDIRATRASWQAVLDLARRWGGEEIAVETIRTTAVARATALGRNPKLHPDTSRMDRAIELLETVIDLASEDPRLSLKLGDLLTDRGVRKANRNDHLGAVQDLERAFSIMPHNHRTRDQYAVALAFLAMDTADDDRSKATEMLTQAEALVKDLADKTDYAKYKRTVELIANVRATIEGRTPPWLDVDPIAELDRVLEDVEGKGTGTHSISLLLAQATLQRRNRDIAGALDTLEEAWELAPEDKDLQDELVNVITERAEQLVTVGATDEQQHLVEAWRKRFASHQSLSAQLDYLQWRAKVWHYLKQTGLKYRRGAQQTILLTFDSPVVGALMVRLLIERDAIFLAGPLPPIPEVDESIVLGNLLQRMSEVMFYRPSNVGHIGPAVVCRMPVRYLDPRWLKFLIHGAYRYADVQPAFLKHPGQLQTHLRSQREVLRLLLPKRQAKPDTLGQLETLCDAQGWPCSRQGENRGAFESPLGAVGLTATDEGIRLGMDLGYLRTDTGRVEIFQRIVELNDGLWLGKLGLTESSQVHLMCELPYLDETGFREAMYLFEQRAEEMKKELVQM
jgi:outer membrane protein assembly factor BamD (BamD/ComL family)